MKPTRIFSIGIIALVTLAAAQQASAQLVNIYNSTGWVNTIATIQENQIVKNALGNTKNKTGSSSASRSTSSSQSEPYVVPAYRRYLAVQFKSTGTQLTVKEAAVLLDPVPADRPETERILSGILDKYEAAAREKGYPNDWALALVSYICLNSRVYHGNTEKPIIPFEQNVGLRDVVAEQATENGIFNNVTDRQKQELYEILVMFGGITYDMYEKAVREKNAEGITTWKRFAAENLKAVGIKP